MHIVCLLIHICFSLRPRWVVPVLPKGELEVLLEAAIDLSKKGRSTRSFVSAEMLCGIDILQSLPLKQLKGWSCNTNFSVKNRATANNFHS